MAATITLTGDKRLDRAFAQLERKTQKQLLRPIVRAAAKQIADSAKQYAPKDKGALVRGIKVRAAKRSRTTAHLVQNVVTILPSITDPDYTEGLDTFYPNAVELGTEHAPAQPFLRPALASKGPPARDEALRKIRSAIYQIGRSAR